MWSYVEIGTMVKAGRVTVKMQYPRLIYKSSSVSHIPTMKKQNLKLKIYFHLHPKNELQSYLSTRQLQNSSNTVLVTFSWEENVSALRACWGLISLVRTYMSHYAALQQQMLHQSVLMSFGTHPEFLNELTSTKVPLYLGINLTKYVQYLMWKTIKHW